LVQDLDEDDLEASFEQYCQDIQETAAWGGQTELNAVAHVVQRHIKVYAAGLPVVVMGQQYQGKHTCWCSLLLSLVLSVSVMLRNMVFQTFLDGPNGGLFGTRYAYAYKAEPTKICDFCWAHLQRSQRGVAQGQEIRSS